MSVAVAAGSPVRSGANRPQLPRAQAPATIPIRENIAEFQRRIDAAFKQLADVNERSRKLNEGTPEFTRRRDELRVQLDLLNGQISTLESERSRIQKEQHGAASSSSQLDSQHYATGVGVGGGGGGGVGGSSGSSSFSAPTQSVESIDARIRSLDQEMMSKRLTASEESRLLRQIGMLKQSRLKILEEARSLASRSAAARAAAEPLKQRLEAIKSELGVCLKKRRDLSESLGSLLSKRKQTTEPLRDIAVERDLLEAEIVECRGQMNRARDEIIRIQRVFESEQNAKRQQREDLKQQQRKIDELKKTKGRLEFKLDNLEAEYENPQVILTKRMLLYVQKLADRLQETLSSTHGNDGSSEEHHSNNTTAAAAASAAEEQGGVDPPVTLGANLKLMAPKAERLSETAFVGGSKKNKKNKQKKIALPGAPLIHDLQTLNDFQKMQLPPPLTLRECPELVETLKNKLEIIQEKHKNQTSSRVSQVQKIIAEIAAIDRAIANGGETTTATNTSDDDDCGPAIQSAAAPAAAAAAEDEGGRDDNDGDDASSGGGGGCGGEDDKVEAAAAAAAAAAAD